MVGSIDLSGLLDGSVVKPQDDVAIISVVLEVRAGNCHGLIGVVGEDCQRASGIKANSSDSGRINVVLVQHSVYTLADAPPDVCCRLLIISLLGLPQSNVLRGHCAQSQFVFPGSRTSATRQNSTYSL